MAGATTFYQLPYPLPTESVDVPRDIKALADKLELWKNGFTVPSGHIVSGSQTDAQQRWFESRFYTGGKLYANRLTVASATNPLYLGGYEDGTRKCLFQVSTAGQAQVGDPTLVRPLPFAIYCDKRQVQVTASENGFLQVVYQNGLFTQIPVQMCISSSSSQYVGVIGSPATTASGYFGVNQIERVAGTATISIHLMAIQIMASTAVGPTAMEAGDESRPVRFLCHTNGCINKDVPIETLRRLDDEVPASCGPCGVSIEDVTNL
jgi:hypothetical protein